MAADLEPGSPQLGAQAIGRQRRSWERFGGAAIALAALLVAGFVASSHWSEWRTLLGQASLLPLAGALLLGNALDQRGPVGQLGHENPGDLEGGGITWKQHERKGPLGNGPKP